MARHQSIDEAFKVRNPTGPAIAVLVGLWAGLTVAWFIVDYVKGGVVDWGRERVVAQVGKGRP